MTTSVTRLSWYGASASEPAPITAEDNAGITFTREDTKSGNPVTSALPIPLTTATVFSWPKIVALEVTGVGTTSIANRRISPAAPCPTGVHWWVNGLTSYAQPSTGTMPPDDVVNGAVPAGYTEALQNVPAVYDATTLSTTSLGRNGLFASMVIGVDGLYALGGGQAGTIPLPNYRLTYDEA